ncbi:MAG: serine/threonine protein kinase [Chloroflexi bacterium]|nr:serine/threonine protein kinase [Chloroflexota bacterium]
MASTTFSLGTNTSTQIRDPRLAWAARLLWLLLVLFNIGIFLYAVSYTPQALDDGCLCDSLLSVEQLPDGRFLLKPRPPIEDLMNRDGVILLAVNGESIGALPVSAESFADVSMLLGGPVDESIALTIQPENLPARTIVLRFSPLNKVAAGLMNFGFSLAGAALFITVLDALVLLGCLAAAVIIVSRRSNDWMALYASGILTGIGLITGETFIYIYYQGSFRPSASMTLLLAGYLLLASLFALLFPNGRVRPRWGLLLPFFTFSWVMLREQPGVILGDLVVLTVNLVIAVLHCGLAYYSYSRHYDSMRRQQTKWVLFGIGIIFLGFTVYPLPSALLYALNHSMEAMLISPLAYLLYRLLSLALPIGFAFAVLRYRLYDVDLVINRSLGYGALTAILAALFFLGLLALQPILGALFPTQQAATLGTILSTAAVVLLFNPLRRRLQALIDTRLFGLRASIEQITKEPQPLPPPKSATLVGQTFGSYEVREPLARGGMGEVYKGYQPSLNRSVAIKVLPDGMAANTHFRARFEREGRTVAALRHPNIVQVYDFGHIADTFYMVMEFVDGRTLSVVLRERGRLPLSETRAIIGDLAAALDYAHAQGVIHRDIKPSNVMLQPTTAPTGVQRAFPYRVVLMDFGIAKMVDNHSSLTQTGMMGTLDYMAPEQIVSARTVDYRADIYSLGTLAYQLLTGAVPFKGDNIAAKIFAHLEQPAPDARSLAPDVPEYAALALARALEKKPAERFASAGALAAALYPPAAH